MNSQPQTNLKPVLNVYKKIGQTPLEVIDEIRLKMPEYKDATMTYAGRLDPLAEGVLLVVVNHEIKDKEHYMHLDKIYEVEILLGVETDTYDVLGLVQQTDINSASELSQKTIADELGKMTGSIIQQYPPYSSKTVNGIPLFQYAREGKLNTIEIPQREVCIYSAEIIAQRLLMPEYLFKLIKEKISLVKGDFRQSEILQAWERNLANSNKVGADCQVITIVVACSEGAYMRTFAHELGKKLNCAACGFEHQTC